MKLDCFAIHANPPEMVPGKTDRPWMDAVAGRVPYRCLPMTMANTTGWELACPFGFTAEWDGGKGVEAIKIVPDNPGGHSHFVQSHFAYGVLTMHTGYLFRTEPGWATTMSGAPNHLKHGIQALSGLIETDWLPFPATMNWMFTAPGRVRFEQGEPFCFVNVVEHGKIEQIEPAVRKLDSDPELKAQYKEWSVSRSQFNAKLHRGDPETLKQAWQKHYFQGKTQEGEIATEGHVNKRRVKRPVVG